MCPDPQLLSIFIAGELPSPWKEKLESHLAECSVCRGKVENLKHLQDLFKKDTTQKRTIVDREGISSETVSTELEMMEKAKEKIWRKLESKRRFHTRNIRQPVNILQRKFSIPIPAAAAAAVIVALATALVVISGSNDKSGYVAIQQVESIDRSGFILAAEEEMPGTIPAADLNSVLQYLGSNDGNIIILQLPETTNFLRSGEPAIIRAADYRREP
jgi:anti-sigma factor RsiW